MAWAEQWTHRVDGVEFNDPATGFFCEVPEVDNVFEQDHVLVPIAQGYPIWHRDQPLAGRLTFLIHVAPTGDRAADYARVQTLKAVMGPGPHTYEVQVRGMPNELTTTIYFDSMMLDQYNVGRWTATATVPDPRLV